MFQKRFIATNTIIAYYYSIYALDQDTLLEQSLTLTQVRKCINALQ